jgi:hypothetical protein
MIYIDDIHDLSPGEIVNVLLDENAQPIQFHLPMLATFGDRPVIEIPYDYLLAAYAGELFHAVADKMTYDYVAPFGEDTCIPFTLYFSNIEGMAQAIFEATILFYNTWPGQELVRCWESIDAFEQQIKKTPENVVCRDFVRTYLEYKGKV